MYWNTLIKYKLKWYSYYKKELKGLLEMIVLLVKAEINYVLLEQPYF